jgi:hypothetical protein
MNKSQIDYSEVRAEQVPKAEAIYLGVDPHKAAISITWIMDHSTPQPARRFNWEQFWRFVQKQLSLANSEMRNRNQLAVEPGLTLGRNGACMVL